MMQHSRSGILLGFTQASYFVCALFRLCNVSRFGVKRKTTYKSSLFSWLRLEINDQDPMIEDEKKNP